MQTEHSQIQNLFSENSKTVGYNKRNNITENLFITKSN